MLCYRITNVLRLLPQLQQVNQLVNVMRSSVCVCVWCQVFIYSVFSIRIPSFLRNCGNTHSHTFDMNVKCSKMFHLISVMRQINNGIIYYYIIMWNEHQLKCIHIALFLSLILPLLCPSLSLAFALIAQ